MNKFTVEIPNDRIKTYRIVTFIILTMNFIGFGYVFLRSDNNISSGLSVAALIINAVPWIYYLLNKKHLRSPAIEITGFASAFLWIYFGTSGIGILLIVFALMGFFANRKQQIIFSDEGILYPSFPEKKYSWNEVEQVLWKDDILTIDLKNNKLLQFNIDKKFAEGFDVVGFNEWSFQKIHHNLS